jgi:hypothetical protein
MRKLLGIGGVVLGVVGVLMCATAIGFGWRTTVRTVDAIDRVASRLDKGLSETDARLARVEWQVSTIRSELNDIRGGAEAISADNPELPRTRAEIDRLLDRLVPALDRLDATAGSLLSVAAGLRAAADIVDQLNDDSEAPVRLRSAADAIDRAAQVLNAPRAKIDAVKSAKAVQVIQKLVTLAREAVAGSDLLAEGLAAARQGIASASKWMAEYRDKVVFRAYTAAVANTVVWFWAGLGELCLIGWGRRRFRFDGPAAGG